MTEDKFFTDEEREQLITLHRRLLKSSATDITDDDRYMMREYLTYAIESSCLGRDAFGFNPIVHDMETALILAEEMGMGRECIIAAMLGSTARACDFSIDNVRRDFGEDVASLLIGRDRIGELYKKSNAVNNENFRTLLLSFAEDIRVIFIMIADRLNLMRHIRDTKNADGKMSVSMEASYLYAPLAHKLGLYKLKSELEDLSLKYLEHDAYYHIKEKLNATKKSRDAYVATFISPIEKRLKEAGLKFHMKGRTKSIHSIYQKMKKQKVDVDGVYDLFAIRIILDSPFEKEKLECWQTFSIVTDIYKNYNPARMRDWLTVPKSNGYESLHITVLGPDKKWVEVQIRTERMDDVAEHGLAAHWRYKGVKQTEGTLEDWLLGIRKTLESSDDSQLIDQFKMDLVEDEIYVFTPKGDLFKLPKGATVLDFAYAVHTKVGDKCTGARIGGKNATIRQVLQSGDQVEILTSNNQSPKQDWVNIVKTSKARTKIRTSLKEMQAGQVSMAKELLERKMKNRKIELTEVTLMHTIKKLGFKVVTDFYKALGNEEIDINTVIEEYLARQRHERGEEEKAEVRKADEYVMSDAHEQKLKHTGSEDVMVIDQNLKGIDFQLAKCCHPIYGDDVFGFVTASGGIKIHRDDCPNATQMRQRFGYRIVKARWAGKGGSQYAITLHIVGNDDLGIVNNITSIISKEEKMLMRSISIDSHDGLFSGHLTVMLDDTSKLQQLVKKLKTVRGVKNVTRV
ncbi:MAG: bifunctional (p)ppGpp synthetase/guanosine-3',5'-bis(diphosphate) 3'-pyrophosphohydrolase [Bacteroidales bacterium]|nr:bifunctional (p)ppGpp synthetase/guanosine-3',5'-bis(diphosphate) 3'-pyrophosphohydrolase [Candidatus Physcousia equi]